MNYEERAMQTLAPYVPISDDNLDFIVSKLLAFYLPLAQEQLLRVTEIGCGDARFLHKVYEELNGQVDGYGIEVCKRLSLLANKMVRNDDTVDIKTGDACQLHWAKQEDQLPEIVFLYLMPGGLSLLAKKIKEYLEQGSIFVSWTFSIPEEALPNCLKIKRYLYKEQGLRFYLRIYIPS